MACLASSHGRMFCCQAVVIVERNSWDGAGVGIVCIFKAHLTRSKLSSIDRSSEVSFHVDISRHRAYLPRRNGPPSARLHSSLTRSGSGAIAPQPHSCQDMMDSGPCRPSKRETSLQMKNTVSYDILSVFSGHHHIPWRRRSKEGWPP